MTADSGLNTSASTGALGDLPVLETPFSINVITQALIQNQQMNTPGDVFRNDPSFAWGQLPIPWATLRGFPPRGQRLSVRRPAGIYRPVGSPRPTPGHRTHRRHEGAFGVSEWPWRVDQSRRHAQLHSETSARHAVRQISASYETDTLFGVHADIGDRFGADRQFGYRTNLAYRDGEQSVQGARWEQTQTGWQAARDS